MSTRKSTTRWAVHKRGTEQFGYLCSFKSEAEDLLNDLFKNAYTMSEEEKSRYCVAEVTVTWDDGEEDLEKKKKNERTGHVQ